MSELDGFKSYRQFLKATFERHRKSQPALNLASFAEKLGLGASNYKMIVSGERNLTTHQCLKVARAPDVAGGNRIFREHGASRAVEDELGADVLSPPHEALEI